LGPPYRHSQSPSLVALDHLGQQHNKTIGQLAIAWLLTRPDVCSVIAARRARSRWRRRRGAGWYLDAATLDQIAGILG